MSPALMHLLLILAGVLIALAALWWFARVTGGWLSVPGALTLAFLGLSVWLILAGLGVVGFADMVSP